MADSITAHNQHYAPGNVDAAISAALTAVGKEGAALTIENLAAVDQFHTGGIRATRTLARRATIKAEDRVLDVGGGLGGPARLLAQEFGCQVTVLDLTEAYCRIGETLTERTNLADRVRFQPGNALDLPFEDSAFDVVWTQHVSMNIPNKDRLYAQIHRVLRAGGRLTLHEVTAGSAGPIHFPALWAHDASMNFLVSPDTLRDLLANTGFRQLAWNDASDWSLAWFQDRLSRQQDAGTVANSLGLQLLLGSDFNTMARNQILNLQEQRIRIVEGVFERV